jgi:hypothetical protein
MYFTDIPTATRVDAVNGGKTESNNIGGGLCAIRGNWFQFLSEYRLACFGYEPEKMCAEGVTCFRSLP